MLKVGDSMISTIVHTTKELICPKTDRLLNEKISIIINEKLLTAPLPEIVGRLTGYDFELTDENCGGFCDGWNMKIAVHKDSLKKLKTTFHEIAHSIQFELEVYEKRNGLLSYELYFEHQAESMAYQIWRQTIGDIHHSKFNSYFSKRDVVYLANWYDGWIQNDVI